MVDDTERDSAGNLAANETTTKTFLRLSGYKEADILGSNEPRRSFVTSNGGKYVVNRNGKAVRTILGPPTPNQRKKAAQEEEADE